jgi:hypothetical protein
MQHNKLTKKLLAVTITALSLSACFKDSGTKTYKLYTPVYQATQDVRLAIKSDAPQPLENVGKMVIYGNYIFLNELQKGIHIIDNSSPAKPINKAFIKVPGSENFAIKDNILYTDCFIDLMAIDITNPEAVVYKTYIKNLFPERRYVNGFTIYDDKVIVDWKVKDTVANIDVKEGQGMWTKSGYLTTSLAYSSSLSSSGDIGATGSTSKYAIINNYLYALNSYQIKAVNISNGIVPKLDTSIYITNNLETIFPFQDKLFIGSQSGMFIYSVTNGASPVKLGQFLHARLCDPVIADGNTAYVTLRSNTTSMCQGFSNQLDVIDITALPQTKLIKTYNLTHPYGLSKDGNLLFICDGDAGLKIFDASNNSNLQPLQTISTGSETLDVIALNGIAYVTAKDGLYQYDYKNTTTITLLSKTSLTK